MSTYDPDNRPRTATSSAGGGWIVGIIVVVLVGLGICWWAGTSGAGPRTANTNPSTPAATTGTSPSTPPVPSDTAK
jgi:hypothetical protein